MQYIFDEINRELGIEKIDYEELLIMERGAGVKVTAKAMIKKIKSIGVTKWAATIKKVVNKLPVSQKVKNTILKLFGYKSIMNTLDIISGVSGKIETALTNQFKKMGVNSTVADIASRALTRIFF